MFRAKKVVLAMSGGLIPFDYPMAANEFYGCDSGDLLPLISQGEELEACRAPKPKMMGASEIYVEIPRRIRARFRPLSAMFRAKWRLRRAYLLGHSIASRLISKRLVEIAAKPEPMRLRMCDGASQ